MNPTLKSYILVIITNFLVFASLSADCIVDYTDDPSGSRITTAFNLITFGQSFVACDEGMLTEMTVNTGGGNLQLFLVEGDGRTINLATPYQTFPSLPNGDVKLKLATPFKVKKDKLYAFAISNTADVLFDWSPDADGADAFRIIGGSFTAQPNNDLYFKLTIETPTIPTLSEWGLIVLTLLILNMAIFYLLKLKPLRRTL